MSKRIGRFNLIRTLGSGMSCKVKLALDTKTGKKVALKILKDNMGQRDRELVETEVAAMKNLKHPNVIEQVECGQEMYIKADGRQRKVFYIVLELAAGGELFDFVANSGRFKENVARYYFKQILDGLDYCHSNGVTHRDLKPENLFLDGNYTLKLGDFGFAGPVEGRDDSGYLRTILGTKNYMAPEIHLKQPYQGRTVDLFAAAIILFIMVAQHPPFTSATPNDPFYRCLAANRADIFWKNHCQNKENGDAFFSEEFKQIIQGMLQLDPSHRPSIPDIREHPWMKGPMPTKEQILQEFSKRDLIVKKTIEDEREQKLAEKMKRVENQRKTMRGVAQSGSEETKFDESGLMKPTKQIDEFVGAFAQSTQFFSTYSPDMIEKALVEYLR